MTDTKGPALEDESFMRRALELARNGWGQTAPNPMVGAVVVRYDTIVGEGFHARFGEAHAEVVALHAAGVSSRGSTLYVTLEPCRHHGKTPPCTDVILATGVRRVVIATMDPTPLAGGGAEVLRHAGVEVTVGVLERDARELNAPFFHAAAHDMPWTTLKLAVSMDLAIASERGTTSRLTSAESMAEVHRLRAGQDGIAVGVGTVLADDPLLTVRHATPPRKPPARVIFDRKLRTPLQSKLVFTARETPTILVTAGADGGRADAMRDAGVHVITADGLEEGFRRLRAAGIQALMIEGGAALASAVLQEGLVQRMIIFQAPVLLGAGSLYAFEGASSDVLRSLEDFPVLQRQMLGPDVMTVYSLQKS